MTENFLGGSFESCKIPISNTLYRHKYATKMWVRGILY